MPTFTTFLSKKRSVNLPYHVQERQVLTLPNGETRPYLPLALAIIEPNKLEFQTRGSNTRDILHTKLATFAQCSGLDGTALLAINIAKRDDNALVVTINSTARAMTPMQAINALQIQEFISPETARAAQRVLAQLTAQQPAATETSLLLAAGPGS